MSIRNLISELRELNIKLWVDDGKLRYSAAKEVMTTERLKLLAEHKLEIIEWLNLAISSDDQIENALNHIKHRVRSTGERELPSLQVGEEVMAELRDLDPVAYVRFASVYRSCEDVQTFEDELRKLVRGNRGGSKKKSKK